MVRERITNRTFNDTFLAPPSAQDAPSPVRSFYETPHPLEVDVGCGRGRFLIGRATKCPHLNFLGIDLSLLRLRKIDRKAVAGNLANIRLIHGEALHTVAALPTDSVSTFYVYFPDPWPKRRHHSRRLVAAPFVESITNALAPLGKIHLCTDHSDYFMTMQRVWRGDPRYTEIEPYLPSPDEETDFCLLFQSQGLKANRCSFQKRASNLIDAKESVG
jgi:tRNA (guanine-N7-)-methyltransferase